MHYSYEYKLECVELYRKGIYPATPEGTTQETFRNNICTWTRMEESCSPDALKHKNFNKTWTPEEKYELVAKVIAGFSRLSVALNAGINPGMLYQWVQKYKNQGYNGLIGQKKGRPSKKPSMKKKVTPEPLTKSERQGLIRLRAEIEYMKAENEVIKNGSP